MGQGQFRPPPRGPRHRAQLQLPDRQGHPLPGRSCSGRILADFPEFAQLAWANREFVTRAVHYVATQGVIQFTAWLVQRSIGRPSGAGQLAVAVRQRMPIEAPAAVRPGR